MHPPVVVIPPAVASFSIVDASRFAAYGKLKFRQTNCTLHRPSPCDSEMKKPCPTLVSLKALGFKHRRGHAGETAYYEFLSGELTAFEAPNRYFQDVVHLMGVLSTERTISMIETSISKDIYTNREAAAWISYVLKPYRNELQPLPAWFLEGEHDWDLIPFVREERERRIAYENRPKCHIDREYARPFRRMLREFLTDLDQETEMRFGFDGRVLTVEICDRTFDVVARGIPWPCLYRVPAKPSMQLPARFTTAKVEISFFDDCLRFGSHVFEAIEDR